ncbi:MAG TPA: hypothetical protein PKB14_05150 [Rubrivivax sp.]|nr:hypothetical protein [Rubrivivax sp.]
MPPLFVYGPLKEGFPNFQGQRFEVSADALGPLVLYTQEHARTLRW